MLLFCHYLSNSFKRKCLGKSYDNVSHKEPESRKRLPLCCRSCQMLVFVLLEKDNFWLFIYLFILVGERAGFGGGGGVAEGEKETQADSTLTVDPRTGLDPTTWAETESPALNWLCYPDNLPKSLPNVLWAVFSFQRYGACPLRTHMPFVAGFFPPFQVKQTILYTPI